MYGSDNTDIETPASKDQEHNHISRRSALKTLGIGAVGIGSALTISQGGRSTIRIPAHFSGDGVIDWSDVDAEWWDHTTTAREVAAEVKENYLNQPDIVGMEETQGEETIAEMSTDAISIYVKDEATSSVSVPEEIDSIPIDIEEDPEFNDTAYRGHYDTIIGGVAGGSTSSTGSLTCKVKHNGEPRMMAARHLWSTNRCDPDFSPVSRMALQPPDDADDYGRVTQDWQRHDVVVTDFIGDILSLGQRNGFGNQIVDQTGRINGFVGRDRLRELKDSYSDTIRKRGIATGKESGEVVGLGGVIRCDGGQDIDNLVRTTAVQQPADSGGPMYEVADSGDGTKLCIIGPATQSRPNNDSLGPLHGSFIKTLE